jgi:hypothetical protein
LDRSFFAVVLPHAAEKIDPLQSARMSSGIIGLGLINIEKHRNLRRRRRSTAGAWHPLATVTFDAAAGLGRPTVVPSAISTSCEDGRPCQFGRGAPEAEHE